MQSNLPAFSLHAAASTPLRAGLVTIRRTLIVGAVLTLLSACATSTKTPTPANTESKVEAKTESAPNKAAPVAGQAAPFDSVIKGATRQDGLIPIWRKDDKVWLELHPKIFQTPLFFSPKLASGIGEAGIFGGLMQSRWAQVGRPQWVSFRQVNKQVQLLAMNAAYTADANSAQSLAVASAFSHSLMSSMAVASQAQPSTGAILVEATPFLLSDLLGLSGQLQNAFRQNYSLDARNSAVMQARANPKQLVFEVAQHFATNNLASRSANSAPGATAPSTPKTLPDPRSLFITVHYTFSALPEQAMKPRPADQRVGYFTTTVTDFSDERPRSPRKHFINRWRLSKQDPSAPLSPPVEPIVFWMDPSIPEAYRPTVAAGILEWNKAFEAIGYKDAIQVRMIDTASGMDSLATGQASIRWMTNAQPRFGAIGPSHVDPRSGEILGADIALESLSSRSIRTVRSQILPGTVKTEAGPDAHAHDEACTHGDFAAEQLAMGLEVLQAQGLLPPDDPKVEQYVLAYLKDTTMHEVGHTLGLRHNFRASRWRTAQELTHPLLTAESGISASVMEYSPINLPAPGQSAGAPFQTTLGPYDYWAIEYGYGDLPNDEASAKAKLKAIALRSSDPAHADALAFGTDEDNQLGLDPQAMTFDLGRDPIAFAEQRLALIRDLLKRQHQRALTADDEPTLLRRSVGYALRDLDRTSQILLRQIGGLVTQRGAPLPGHDLLAPIPTATQRAALTLLSDAYLSKQAIQISPSLLRRLAPDYLDREDFSQTDFSLAQQTLSLQRSVLNHLMSDTLAERLLDNADKVRDREHQPLSLSEVLEQVRHAIWRDANQTSDDSTAAIQRNLQREHALRLANSLMRPAAGRADARAAFRHEAQTLLKQLNSQRGDTTVAQQHRQACAELLKNALEAQVVRNAP